MTNFEKICVILEAGHLATIRDEDGNYRIARFVIGNEIWLSEYSNNAHEAFLSDGGLYDKSELTETDLVIDCVTPLPISTGPKKYKHGDRVMVLENLRWINNFGDCSVGYQSLIGKVCEIISFDVDTGEAHVIVADKKDTKSYDVPSWCLCPAEVFEEETKETIMIGGKMYEVSDELKIALAKLKEAEI